MLYGVIEGTDRKLTWYPATPVGAPRVESLIDVSPVVADGQHQTISFSKGNNSAWPMFGDSAGSSGRPDEQIIGSRQVRALYVKPRAH